MNSCKNPLGMVDEKEERLEASHKKVRMSTEQPDLSIVFLRQEIELAVDFGSQLQTADCRVFLGTSRRYEICFPDSDMINTSRNDILDDTCTAAETISSDEPCSGTGDCNDPIRRLVPGETQKPKRFYRTFWRGLARRVANHSKEEAMQAPNDAMPT